MNSNEVEIRGDLPASYVDELFKVLKRDGKFIKNYKRLTVDLSPGFDQETRSWNNTGNLDLRIKKSGLEEKISLKVGGYDSLNRKEIEVSINEGEFIDAVAMFEALGFKDGMIYNWENWEFDYKDCEVKITKFREDYYIWEIESKSEKADPYQIAKDLNIEPYTKEGFKNAIDWQNNNINILYSFEKVKKILED